ncbi:MAG: MiaB/RimO family radical SAM methylthiotransferase [Thermosulfidibacteraceae bacterium]
MKVAVVTLGCPKNEVDSKVIINYLRRAGFEVVSVDFADVVIVNTCGFIEDAKRESIDEIMELLEKGKRVFVAGCLAERYRGTIEELIPEVEGWLYIDDIRDVGRIIKGEKNNPSNKSFLLSFRDIEGVVERGSVYVKISDGCNNRCGYCAIPLIRGTLRSRSIEDIAREVKYHLKNGVFEINLVSQDITSYGRDLGDNTNLLRLLEELVKLDGDFRIRLLYAHPFGVSREFVEFITSCEKIVPYIEMPIQHINERILSLMNRKGGKEAVLKAVDLIKEYGLFWRTTLLLGHPGEDEDSIEELINFLHEARPWRVAVFGYSKEEGTDSYALKAPSRKAIREWVSVLNEVIDRIMEEESRSILQSIREVFVFDKEARLDIQAPEIDGFVINREDLRKTGIVRARIVDSEFVDFRVDPI